MGNKILSSILFVVALLLTSCSSDPIVGEWAPDNDTSGNSVTRINSDGTVKFYGDASDGSYSMNGKWSRVEGDERSINVTYDPSTMKINLDNPLAEEIMRIGLNEMASHTLTLTLSEDGERLYGGGNGYFVRY